MRNPAEEGMMAARADDRARAQEEAATPTVGHTPGPWSCFQFSKHHNWKVDTGDEDWYVDVGMTAHSEANAEFIVRACNSYDTMLEALNEAVRYLQFNKGNGSPIYDKCVKAIQQAAK